MPPMATRQQRTTRPTATTNTAHNGPIIFWLIVVIGLIALVFYYGFVKVE